VTLVAVLLLLMIMSAMAAALTVSSTTEALIALNHQRGVQARAAAEAGLAHAGDLVLEYLAARVAAGESAAAAVASLLAGVDTAVPAFAALDAGVELAPDSPGAPRVAYEAVLLDDDDEERDLQLASEDVTRLGENNDPATDANRTLVIRAVGHAGGRASAVVESMVVPARLPALLAAGDVELGTAARIEGRHGSVQARARARAPHRHARDYLALATHVLHDNGDITTVATGARLACGAACAGGWSFAGAWILAGTPEPGAYVAEAGVHVAASGTVTILTTGSVTGERGTLLPYRAGVVLVADGDVVLSGDVRPGTKASPGLVFAGRDLELRGDVAVHGHVIAGRDARVVGRASIVHDGSLDGLFFEMTAWRVP
jgi:hypothetical protein